MRDKAIPILCPFVALHPAFMEKAEVISVCEYLLELIKERDRKLLVLKYVNFLDWFGMALRRNPERMAIIDAFLQAHNITVWCKRELQKFY